MSTFNNTSWDLPEDARKSGLKYPNYNITTTPSGHKIIMDDSEGSESITLEHRSGSLIQFQADGSIVFHSNKDKYQVVFGDDNMLITGAQNITVNGGAQLKIEGNYDVNIHGNMKHTVNGNVELLVNGDMTTTVAGESETVISGNQSTKVAGDSEYNAKNQLVGAETKLSTFSGGQTIVKAEGSLVAESPSVDFVNG